MKMPNIALGLCMLGMGIAFAGPVNRQILVTFLTGDVSAAAQSVSGINDSKRITSTGPFTASIDFAKFKASSGCSGTELGILDTLQARNPIAYSDFTIKVDKDTKFLQGAYLSFKTSVNGATYTVFLSQFANVVLTPSATDDTVTLTGGKLTVNNGTTSVVSCGGGLANSTYTATKS